MLLDSHSILLNILEYVDKRCDRWHLCWETSLSSIKRMPLKTTNFRLTKDICNISIFVWSNFHAILESRNWTNPLQYSFYVLDLLKTIKKACRIQGALMNRFIAHSFDLANQYVHKTEDNWLFNLTQVNFALYRDCEWRVCSHFIYKTNSLILK